MKCYSCGKELSDGAKFCRFCGAKMIPPAEGMNSAAGEEREPAAAESAAAEEPAQAEHISPRPVRRFCTSCGAPVPEGYKFCTVCGNPLRQAAGTPEPVPEEPQPAESGPAAGRTDMEEEEPAKSPVQEPAAPAKRVCTNCGSEIPEGYKFCTVCGTPAPTESPGPANSPVPEPAPAPAARVCTNCGAEIPEGYKFCISCGTPAPGTQGAGPGRSPGHPGGGESSAPGSRGGVEPPVRGTSGEDEGGRKKGVSPVILIIVAAVVILAAIAAVFVLTRGDDDGAAESAVTEEAAQDTEEEAADESSAEEDEAQADEAEEDQEETAEEETVEEEPAEEEESSEDETEEDEAEEEEDSGIDPEVEAAVEDILAKIDEIDAAAESGDAGTYLLEEDSYTVILLDEEIVRISAGEETYSSGYARHYYYEDGEVLAAFYISDSASQQYYFEDGELIRWVEQEDLALADGAVTHDREDSAEYEELGTVIPEEAAELLEEMEEAIASQTEYILEGSDSRYIDESELEDLSEEELRLARNEIYARNGRKFNDETLTEYFSQFDWYEPTIDPDDFTDSMLNEYELENVQTIVAYEEKMGYR